MSKGAKFLYLGDSASFRNQFCHANLCPMKKDVFLKSCSKGL